KRTPDLVPLCHTLAIGAGTVDLEVTEDSARGAAVETTATVRTADRTGVEMEALSAVTVARQTVIDMVKAVGKLARNTEDEVADKTGGKSGDWRRRDETR